MPETAVHVASGKVARSSKLDSERLLLVASDRISTFDVVLPRPRSGPRPRAPGLSRLWFARTRKMVPNHLLALRPDGRSTEAKRLQMLPIECVVRGYLAGSGWKDYCATGATSGHELEPGCGSRTGCRLIFTPATKAQTGRRREHRPRPRHRGSRRRGVSLAEVERIVLDSTGTRPSTPPNGVRRGHEVGTSFDENGELVLGDEALTPDSSASGPRDVYTPPGGPQPHRPTSRACASYCERLGWDKTAPGPELPEEVVGEETRAATSRPWERLRPRALARGLPRRPRGRPFDEGDRPRSAEGRDSRPQGEAVESARPAGFSGRRGARRARDRPRRCRRRHRRRRAPR